MRIEVLVTIGLFQTLLVPSAWGQQVEPFAYIDIPGYTRQAPASRLYLYNTACPSLKSKAEWHDAVHAFRRTQEDWCWSEMPKEMLRACPAGQTETSIDKNSSGGSSVSPCFELPKRDFVSAASLPKQAAFPEPTTQCQQLVQGWTFNKMLEDKCGFTRNVSQKILAASKDICPPNMKKQKSESWVVSVHMDVEADVKKMGTTKFCESNRPGYDELADAQR